MNIQVLYSGTHSTHGTHSVANKMSLDIQSSFILLRNIGNMISSHRQESIFVIYVPSDASHLESDAA